MGETEIPSRAYVAAFGFKGSDQQKRAGVLSGGERNRLNLALTLKQGGNLLLLDEPTNDLDVETLESLEEALEEFPGCSVVISPTAGSSTAWPRTSSPGRATTRNPAAGTGSRGNFEAYQADREKRLGAEASSPTACTASSPATRRRFRGVALDSAAGLRVRRLSGFCRNRAALWDALACCVQFSATPSVAGRDPAVKVLVETSNKMTILGPSSKNCLQIQFLPQSAFLLSSFR